MSANSDKNCTTCAHHVLDDIWGEIKCKKNGRVMLNIDDYGIVYGTEDFSDCEFYEEEKLNNDKD